MALSFLIHIIFKVEEENLPKLLYKFISGVEASNNALINSNEVKNYLINHMGKTDIEDIVRETGLNISKYLNFDGFIRYYANLKHLAVLNKGRIIYHSDIVKQNVTVQ